LRVEHLAISKLKEYSRNTRTHSAEQIAQVAASIKEFGFTNPVLIDENNEIIAGHGRTAAARSLGMDTVPVIRLKGLTETQIRALRIADNKLALNAGWDYDLLSQELTEIKLDDFNLDIIGFSLEELDEILNADIGTEETERDPEEDIPPEPPAEPITKPGDIWQLGEHYLICGDSTNPDTVKALMQGEQANLWLTDPPYNVDYEGQSGMKIQNDSMQDLAFRDFLRKAYKASVDVLAPGGAFYIWHADSEGFNFRGAARDVGLQVRQCLIWNKSSLVLGRQDYQWKHEPCLYGWKDGAAHNWYNDRSQTTVLDFDKPKSNNLHPTMKPVALFEYLIENSTAPGDIVLDTFGGSGTTLIACENLGRRCYMCELDPIYASVIIQRYEEHTGDKAVLLAPEKVAI
jgi:site-specific DNA-methyltransferase (adenine-specific)